MDTTVFLDFLQNNNLDAHRSNKMFLSSENLAGCFCSPRHVTHIEIVDFLRVNVIYKQICEKINSSCEIKRLSLPAVTAFVKIILLLMVLLPLRGTRCWNMVVKLTPSIIPLVTFNCSFTTKEFNFVPGGSRGSLVFTKVFIGTSSIYPVSQLN
jgi:hypothetical protein